MIYAGIGRRTIAPDIRESFEKFGRVAQEKGFKLRSGGADGCDLAFEKYVRPENKEIYLPWKGFNGSESPLFHISKECRIIASKIHPNWGKLKPSTQLFMARNCYQILGINLNEPVDFVVCWTENGNVTGGTGQALRLAQTYDIRIFNFGDPKFSKKELWEELNSY